MAISADLIKQLRETTGAGILDCRTTLEQTGGDMDKAVAVLREKGLAAAAKRADRVTKDGVIELYSHGNGRVGVMVEVNCETDFVARTEEFRHFAHEIALQVAANSAKYLDVADVPEKTLEEQKTLAAAQAKAEGKPAGVVEKIVEGRLAKFYQDVCLLQQPYIRDENMTVGDLFKQIVASTRENVVIRRFARWELGADAE
ncbi:MAG: translation elongation factor Ts [Anaerolineales bacterium]|nr:translation elongation factor Ts [Anaerolineales bacterium]